MSETYKSALAFIQFNYPALESARCRESTDKAIEALEKQTPKKPIYDSTSCPGLCPKCLKDYINILIMNGTKFCDRVDYCPNCGQKLDWD